MRYQNWDVLVFPDQCKIPTQEFKTTCQVVQDSESHTNQTGPHLLPTVTCFIPSLLADTPFRISIHCWENPEVSRYLRSFLKSNSDRVMFEARLFIDGRIVGTKWFNEIGPWPAVLDLSMDLDKNGDFEKLKFPGFHKEVLSQSYWSAGDDLGRIKIVLAEGFGRDNLSYPFDRIKNIAAFSFQHAPLDVLEQSSIAWPNASMWRQVSIAGPFLAQQSPRACAREGQQEAHSHSPRQSYARKKSTQPHARASGDMLPPSAFQKLPSFDPFTEQVHAAFTGWRQPSDTSMPDYSSSSSSRTRSRQFTDPMSISGIENRPDVHDNQVDPLCDVMMPRVPVNTPQAEASPPPITKTNQASNMDVALPSNGIMPVNLVSQGIQQLESVTTVVLEPVFNSNVKSKKDNVQESPTTGILGKELTSRKVSQTFAVPNSNSSKRQRRDSTTLSRGVEDDEVDRNSPSLRKVSRAVNLHSIPKQDENNPESGKQDLNKPNEDEGLGERRVLGNVANGMLEALQERLR